MCIGWRSLSTCSRQIRSLSSAYYNSNIQHRFKHRREGDVLGAEDVDPPQHLTTAQSSAMRRRQTMATITQPHIGKFILDRADVRYFCNGMSTMAEGLSRPKNV